MQATTANTDAVSGTAESHAQTHAAATPAPGSDAWVANASLLWANRRFLALVTAVALVVGTAIAFSLPKQYESSTSIMPPEQSTGNAAMLAALVGRSAAAPSGVASLASGLLGGRSNGSLFLSLLRSGTVAGHLIDRFQLQQVYHNRYVMDTAKRLARKTTIVEDAKSGVITITVEDTDRARARDMAQAYVDELNALVARVDTSSAHRERVFIEQRLQSVDRDLQQAQVQMSEFSSKNSAIDIQAQTRAMMDAGARLQGELVASESELDSLEQIYGGQNVRVRAAEARVGVLRHELERESGSSNGGGQSSESGGTQASEDDTMPALRQLPALAVPWANLYRRVRIEETVYEMLSAQYETARIEEAKSIPTVSVIDAAGLPERKSSPHRLMMMLAWAASAFVAASLFVLARRAWRAIEESDPRRVLAGEIGTSLKGIATRIGGGRR